jgi:hypothetical protein
VLLERPLIRRQELTRGGVRFRKADNAFLAVADVPALQAAADRLSASLLERRCNYWVRRVVPVFSPDERDALRPGYRYSMAQMELATDVVLKRAAPLRGLFQRACELGVLVGGAKRTTHLFGRRINRRHEGKLQTVLDQRDLGHPRRVRSASGRDSGQQWQSGQRRWRVGPGAPIH